MDLIYFIRRHSPGYFNIQAPRPISPIAKQRQFLKQSSSWFSRDLKMTKPGRITAVHCTDIHDIMLLMGLSH